MTLNIEHLANDMRMKRNAASIAPVTLGSLHSSTSHTTIYTQQVSYDGLCVVTRQSD